MGLLGRHAAPQPLVDFDVWGQRGWANVEVAGESHYYEAIKALLPKALPEQGVEVFVPVRLVHEPTNKYDMNAVEVRGSSGLLGFLPRDDAARYAPTFAGLQSIGHVATTSARIWGGERSEWGTNRREFWGSVRVELAEPHMLVPANFAPSGPWREIPRGNAIQVSEEALHSDAISPFLSSHGECWAYATLHQMVDESARTPKPFVEVRLDGLAAGRLTPKMSSELLPAIEFVESRGETCVARAAVKGNQLKAEIVLYTQRAHEIGQDWFDSVGQSATAHESERGNDQPLAAQVEVNADPISSAATTPAAPPLPPADWHEDPLREARLRYWDGTSWTSHVAP